MATFGEKLRDLMAERGLSLRKLAPRIPCDVGYLSKVSRDLKVPSAEMAALIDDALDAGGNLAALRTPLNGHLDGDEEERLLLAAARPVRTDLTVVESLATILAAQRRTEDIMGSAPLMEPVRAQLAAIEGMVAEARGAVRPALLDVAAQWSQFSGWLHTSVGDYGQAMEALTRTLQWGTEIGDSHLIGSVMSWQGYVAERRGHVGSMVGLSQAGQRAPRGSADRVTALYQEARARALLGEADEVHRLVDIAAEEAREMRPGGARPWEYYYEAPAIFGLEHGIIYRILGRTDPPHSALAVEHLTAGLDVLPSDMRASEWAGTFLHQLALAYRQAGEPGEAARVIDEMWQIAARVESERLQRLAASLNG